MDNANSKIILYLARLIQRMYGNNSSVKCIVNQHGDSAHVKDANLLLSLLEIEHPVAQLIVSLVSAHSHRYGSGIKSLIVMMGQLTEAFISLQEQGVPRDVIISLMRQILDLLMNKVEHLKLNIAFSPHKPEPIKAPLSRETCQQEPTTSSTLGSSRIDRENHQCRLSGTSSQLEVSGQQSTLCTTLGSPGRPKRESRNGSHFTQPRQFDQEQTLLSALRSGRINIESLQSSFNLVKSPTQDTIPNSPVKSRNEDSCEIQVPKFQLSINSGKLVKSAIHDHITAKPSGNLVNSVLERSSMLENHQGKMSETRVVHLHMAVSNDGDDDVEDVDWYFDKNVPKAAETSPGTSYTRSLENVPSDSGDLVSSLRDSDQHDADFDDCFDGEDELTETMGQVQTTDVKPSDTAVKSHFDDCFDEDDDLIETTLVGQRQIKDIKLLDVSAVDSNAQNEVTETNHMSKREAVGSKMDLTSLNKMLMEVRKKNGGQKELDSKEELNYSSRHLNGLSEDMILSKPCSSTIVVTSSKIPQDKGISNGSLAEQNVKLREKDQESSSNLFAESKSESKMPQDKGISNGSPAEQDVKLGEKEQESLCAKTRSESFEKMLHKKLADKSKQAVRASLTHSRHFKSCDDSLDNLTLNSSSVLGLDSLDEAGTTPSERDEGNLEPFSSKTSPNSDCKDLIDEKFTHSNLKSEKVPRPSEMSKQGPNIDIMDNNFVSKGDGFEHSKLRSEGTPAPQDAKFGLNSSWTETQELKTETTPESKDTSKQIQNSDSGESRELSLHQAAAGLSRGCTESMELVLETAVSQMRRRGRFNSNLITTCTMSYLPSSGTCVVDGLVVECETDLVADLGRETRRNTLLVNGDLSSTSRHQGYKNSTKGKHVIGSGAVTESASPDRWILECLDALQQFSVTLLLVKGCADMKVKDTLRSKGILLIERVSYRVLQALRETTGVELVIYVEDCSQINVCERLIVKPYDLLWMDKMAANKGQTTHVVINTATTSALQTVLICHPSCQAAEIQEQEVMSCSRRLEEALHDGTVLPGGGRTEQYCSEYLLKNYDSLRTSEKNQPFIAGVACAQAEVFNNMVNLMGVDRTLLGTDPEHSTDSRSIHGGEGEGLSSIRELVSSHRVFEKSNESNMTSEHTGQDFDHGGEGVGLPSIRKLVSSHRVFEKSNESNMTSVEKDVFEKSNVTSEHIPANTEQEFEYFVKLDGVCEIYDNFQSKMAAWSVALDTVSMVTQTDAHIVTGVTSTDLKNGVFINGVIL